MFWRTYADLAWAVQETASSARASEQLIATGQALAVDYQRLLELYSGSEPRRAYGYALAGWQRFHTPLYWYAMADTGLRSGQAKALALFLKNLGLKSVLCLPVMPDPGWPWPRLTVRPVILSPA